MNPEAETDSLTSDGAFKIRELRPGERLLEYLLAEFERPEFKTGSRLPTNIELAKKLGISPGTVQSVLQKLAREGRVSATRGSGTYLIQSSGKVSRTLRIGIGVPLARFESADGWMSKIAGGIFQAALAESVAIEGISDRAVESQRGIEELREKQRDLDALILFPYVFPLEKFSLIQDYEKQGKPVVHIYPPSLTATANFSTTDFLSSGYELGRAWKKSGRQRVALLSFPVGEGDMRIAISHHLRYAGLANGFGYAGGGIENPLRILQTADPSPSIESGYDCIKRLLASGGELPDAIFCAGDWLALGAFHALIEAGVGVPEEVSIVGASGLDLSGTDCQNLTRVNNDLARVGQAAMDMVLRRLELKCLDLPGIVVPISFIGGATTRPEENALLGCS